MKQKWLVFRDKRTGKELCSYTISGTFPGEMENTKQLLAAERCIPIENITVTIEAREDKSK